MLQDSTSITTGKERWHLSWWNICELSSTFFILIFLLSHQTSPYVWILFCRPWHIHSRHCSVFQEWTDKWYGWLTVPLVPLWHWVGANDSGALFACLWYANFPDQGAGGKCNKDFWGKWVAWKAGQFWCWKWERSRKVWVMFGLMFCIFWFGPTFVWDNVSSWDSTHLLFNSRI